MKKRIMMMAIVVICLAATTTGTLAYFTAEGTARNVIATGNISIEIIEKTKDNSGTLVDFPKEGISGLMPGASASKIVQVQNTGDAEAWIRVKIESAIKGKDGAELPLTIGKDKEPVMNYHILEGWKDGGDGYYYYEKPVAAGAFTGILLEEVYFSPKVDNTYQSCTANIIISAQAVQTANNGTNVLEARGWAQD